MRDVSAKLGEAEVDRAAELNRRGRGPEPSFEEWSDYTRIFDGGELTAAHGRPLRGQIVLPSRRKFVRRTSMEWIANKEVEQRAAEEYRRQARARPTMSEIREDECCAGSGCPRCLGVPSYCGARS
jgi:hypothetical protein